MNNVKKSVLIITICVALICGITVMSFAVWSNKLEPTQDFELTSGLVTHLEFGGAGGVPILEKIEPGRTVSARVTLKSTAGNLNVTFGSPTIMVKLKGSEEFTLVEPVDSDIISLTPIESKLITTAGTAIEFRFTMKSSVDYKYSAASFKITIKATGTVAVS